jgi:hypothetical protein
MSTTAFAAVAQCPWSDAADGALAAAVASKTPILLRSLVPAALSARVLEDFRGATANATKVRVSCRPSGAGAGHSYTGGAAGDFVVMELGTFLAHFRAVSSAAAGGKPASGGAATGAGGGGRDGPTPDNVDPLRETGSAFYLAQCTVWEKEDKAADLPLLSEAALRLWTDCIFPQFRGAGGPLSEANLWASPRETSSAPHFDTLDNVLCVLAGKKRVLLLPPAGSSLFGPGVSLLANQAPAGVDFFGAASAAASDSASPHHHLLSQRLIYAEIPAGSALYVPEGWWHAVESDASTVALNFWSEGVWEQVVRETPLHQAGFVAKGAIRAWAAARAEETRCRRRADAFTFFRDTRLAGTPRHTSICDIVARIEAGHGVDAEAVEGTVLPWLGELLLPHDAGECAQPLDHLAANAFFRVVSGSDEWCAAVLGAAAASSSSSSSLSSSSPSWAAALSSELSEPSWEMLADMWDKDRSGAWSSFPFDRLWAALGLTGGSGPARCMRAQQSVLEEAAGELLAELARETKGAVGAKGEGDGDEDDDE